MRSWRWWRQMGLVGLLVVTPTLAGLAVARAGARMAVAGRAAGRRLPIDRGAYAPAGSAPAPAATPSVVVGPRRPALRIF